MTKAIIILLLAGAYLAFSGDGMAKCMETHSEETCFYSLNH